MGLGRRLKRLPGQVLGRNPFGGTLKAHRLSIGKTGWLTLRNFRTPLKILEWVFQDDEDLKYLDVPFCTPILFLRDPELIREITVETALDGDFDRDTLPTQGIGRVVGKENLLYSQGETWRRHKGAVVKPFGTKAVQTPEVFKDLEINSRLAVAPQIEALAQRVKGSQNNWQRMQLEQDIKAVMLNLLVNILFGSKIDHQELTEKYLPAIEHVIRYIMWDTMVNRLRLPVCKLPTISPRHGRLKRDFRLFEELTDRVIATRTEGAGFWPLLTAAGTEEAVRSNVRVFLAGALEATASYISWTLVNLARHPLAQEKAYREAIAHAEMTPETRENATYLQKVLAESLRLNNALYFLPRVALRDTTLTTSKGTLTIPAKTHLILATYHMNRAEKYWGVESTGYPALEFVPERWEEANMQAHGRSSKDNLHFGFGHGPRVCIGKHFSEAEAYVCVTLFLRRFQIRATTPSVEADSGVSTRPSDHVDVELSLRELQIAEPEASIAR